MANYRPVTPELLDELRDIVGGQHTFAGEAIPAYFGHDAGTRHDVRHLPEVLVQPADADQVPAILRLANLALVPVTPRGGGTGLAGGAVPLQGGILLDLGRLDRILRIDARARFILV
jgi:glycolate oxidase